MLNWGMFNRMELLNMNRHKNRNHCG